MDTIQNFMNTIESIQKFSITNWIGDVLRELLQSAMYVSTDVCIIAGLIGAILYIYVWKKSRSVPFVSYAIYLIIQIISGVLLG